MGKIILLLIFAYCIFTGCSKSDSTAPEDPTPVEPDPPTQSIPDNKIDTLGNWQLIHKSDIGANANITPKFSQVIFPTKDTGYLVDAFYSNNVYLKRTYDGGRTWTYKHVPGGLNKFQFMNGNVGFGYEGITTDSKMLGRTTNNGDTWFGYPTLTMPYNPYFEKLTFPTDSVIYAVTRIGQFLKITDPLTNQLNSSIVSSNITGNTDGCSNIYFSSLKEGWMIAAGNGSGSVFSTIDSGATWQKQYNADTYLYDMSFTDSKTGWITTLKNYFFKTTDGKNWNKIIAKVNTPYPVMTDNIIFLSTERGFMTSGKEVFETNNGGASWTRICKFGNQSINDMYYTKPDILWVCTNDSLYLLKL